MKFKVISIEQIEFPGDNPRLTFADESMDELVRSLKRDGLIEPIIVRPRGQNYELVVGERRVRAAIKANISKIPAIIRDDLTDEETSRLRIIENLNRKDLNVFERVLGIKAHVEKYGKSLEQTVDDLHLNIDTVRNWFVIAESTSPSIKGSDIFVRKLGIDTLRYLSKYIDETQEILAKAIVENNLKQDQVRRLINLFDSNPIADINTLVEKAKEQVKVVEITVPEEKAKKILKERKSARQREKKAAEKLREKHLRPRRKKSSQVEKKPKQTSENPQTLEVPYQLPSIKRLWDEALAKEVEKAHLSGREIEVLNKLKTQYKINIMQPKEVNTRVKELVTAVLNETRPQIMVLEVPPQLYKSIGSFSDSENILLKDAVLAFIEEGLERHGFWKRVIML